MAKLGPDELMRRVERALHFGGGFYAPEDIAVCVDEGRMQAFSHENSLVVTEVLTSPRRKIVNVTLAAGELCDFKPLEVQVMAFAAKEGCDAIRMGGRKGWAAVLPRLGYTDLGLVNFERKL